MLFAVNDLQRFFCARVVAALTGLVFPESTPHIRCNAGIDRAVRTQEEIDVIHVCSEYHIGAKRAAGSTSSDLGLSMRSSREHEQKPRHATRFFL